MTEVEKIKTEKIISNVAQFFILLSLLVPMMVMANSFIFPFVFTRTVFFEITIAFACAAYLLLLFLNPKKYAPKKNVIFISMAIFLGSWILSAFFGVDFSRSIWDTHERMLGVYAIIHYVILYIVASSTLRSWKEWKTVWVWYILLSVIVFFIGLIQIFEPGFFLNRDATRIASTLGNPLYVSEHAVFVILIAVYVFVKEKSVNMRSFLGVAIALGFINFIASNPRSTGIAVIAAFLSSVILLVIFGAGAVKAKKIALSLFVVFILVMGVLYAYRQSAFVSSIPVLGRIVNIDLKTGAGGAEARFIAWGIAIEAGKQKFLFGWGPANYYYAFNYLYNPISLQYGWNETWFDAAHNHLLNTFAERGFTGVLSYLFIFIAPFIILLKKRKDESGVFILIWGSSILVLHFVHNFFVFENVTSYQYFFLFLAFITYLTNANKNHEDLQINTTDSSNFFLKSTIAVLLIFAIVWHWDINPARANAGVTRSMVKLSENITEGWKEFQIVSKIYTPHKEDVIMDFSNTLLQFLPKPANDEEKKFAYDILSAVRVSLALQRESFPREIRLNMRTSAIDRALYTLTGDKRYYEDAIAVLDDALKNSPKRQQLIFEKAGLLIGIGEKDEAIAALENTVKDAPTLFEPKKRLAFGYAEIGQFDKAYGYLIGIMQGGHYPLSEQEMAAFVYDFVNTKFTTETIISDINEIASKMMSEKNLEGYNALQKLIGNFKVQRAEVK